MRRLVLLAAAPAAMILALSAVAAQASDSTIAPPGTASATALQVGDLVGVSTTGATAGADTSSAQASVLEVGGQPVLGLGGAQTGDGESSGALVDIGSTAPAPAQVQVAPWAASSGTSAGERTADGSAAAARADVPGVAGASALSSDSHASHRAEKSTATGSSDGLTLGLLDILRIVFLHSEVSSEGTGSSYLLGVNGTEIGSDEQLGSICALEISPLARLACLAASGGLGADGVTAGAADLATVESALPLGPASAFSVRGSSGVGAEPISVAAPTDVVAGAGAEASRDAAAAPAAAPAAVEAAAGSGTLPRTGAALAGLAALALLAVVTGALLRLTGRRPALATV